MEDVKQALLTWGFREDEIQGIVEDEMNMPDFDDDEYPKLEHLSSRNEKTLVFMLYRGHGVTISGCTSGFGDMGEVDSFEGFLRDCSFLPNVDVIGLLDCCRRDRGRGGMVAAIEDSANFAVIYREETHDMIRNSCTCEPWMLGNMGPEFITHMMNK